jgi:ribosome-associated protein
VPGRKPAPPESRELAVSAARAASAKQGDRIVVLDVRDLIVITDYFVIVSGTSDRQVRTIVEEVEKSLRGQGVKAVRREGEDQAAWVLLDFVDVVVHVFGAQEREYYDLERLWRDAPVVEWEEAGAASSG